jgi:hypothetical protein
MPLESSAQHRHHLTQCRSPYLVIDPHACSIRQDDLDPTHAKCRRLRRGRRRTWRGCVYRLSGGLYLALGAPFALQNSYGQKFRHNRRWDQLTTANLMPPCPKLTTRNIVPPGHMRKHRPRRLSLSNNPKLLLQPPAAPALNPRQYLHPKPSHAHNDAHTNAVMSAHYDAAAGGSHRMGTIRSTA